MTVLSQTTTFVSRHIGKRLFDVCGASFALILLMPLCMLVGVLIRIESAGGAIFKQQRVGRQGVLFTIWKFRTMRQGTPDLSTREMHAQTVSPITPLGRILRRFSVDELPQLVNILRGEMSFVGPRPALPSQTVLNALREQGGIHALRPGLTGWAQINGRDELGDVEKAAFDAEYLRRVSLRFDVEILIKTFVPLVTGRGNR